MPVLMLTARGSLDDRLEGSRPGPMIICPSPSPLPSWRQITVLARRAEELPPPSSISDR
jgi:hypothetical protein